MRRQWDSVSLVPDPTDRRKAPSSRLLGLSARSAASAAMPLRAVLRARGHRAHVVLASRPKQRPSLLGPSARSVPARDARAGCASRARGHRAHVVLASRPKQRPSLLGPSARSVPARDARAGCASRARGHRAHVVLASRPKQRPSLLGPSARSAPAARRSGRMRLTGEGSATPPRVPLPSKLRAASFFLNLGLV